MRARRRRLRRTILAFAVVDLVIVLGVLVLVGVIAGGSKPAAPVAERLPSFVTGAGQRALAPAFDRTARESRVPATLVMGLAWRESEWEENLVSDVGAVGIGQLLPATSAFVADDLLHLPRLDPHRAVDNIRLTARYLRALIDELGGNEHLGVGAYLQGSTSVRTQGLSPETVSYVHDVETLRSDFDRARRGH